MWVPTAYMSGFCKAAANVSALQIQSLSFERLEPPLVTLNSCEP